MCGIAGCLAGRVGQNEHELRRVADSMAHALTHRGPDDAGSWVDPAAGVALGFRRLAVIDVSQAGHQPMASACGRYVVVFNGEIYNHRLLRNELSSTVFRGHSDTEVMLAAFSRWGVREATTRFNGMFAFAVWDKQRRCLTLGRDRLGEKPLYYGKLGHDFLFGSELKALRAVTGFHADIDRNALTLFLRHGYIPAPQTIYCGIAKLPPGHLLEVSAAASGSPVPYWSAREAAKRGASCQIPGDEKEASDQLEELLHDAVRLRLEADVPLGAFLSGGVDSSLVVALMQSQMSQPVRTFTIGFTESGYDEAPHARSVAAHLGTSHTELYVTPQEAMEVIPRLASMYDEPFSDSSQIPTHLVSALARRDVTVSLSGDGGDELFGGYSRYVLLGKLWSKLDRLPWRARRAVATALTRLPPQRWDTLIGAAGHVLPLRARYAHPGDKVHKLAAGLRHRTPEEVYLQLVSLWQDPASVVLGATEPQTPLTAPSEDLSFSDPALRAMLVDSVTYLPDDILAKIDRAAMAVSLETRVPLLDHRLFEFAWQLPPSLRYQRGGKYLLRQVLHKYVPRELVERPKMGFGVPIGVWLRGPLRPWAEELLDEQRLRSQGLLDPRPVRAAWDAHLSGRVDLKYQLWAVLMLQAWWDEQVGS